MSAFFIAVRLWATPQFCLSNRVYSMFTAECDGKISVFSFFDFFCMVFTGIAFYFLAIYNKLLYNNRIVKLWQIRFWAI